MEINFQSIDAICSLSELQIGECDFVPSSVLIKALKKKKKTLRLAIAMEVTLALVVCTLLLSDLVI